MLSLLKSKPQQNTLRQLFNYQLGQGLTPILGAVRPAQQASLPRDFNFDAHLFHAQFGSSHYGVMIPDLPEPYRYLSFASVIAEPGAQITQASAKLSAYSPTDTATLVHSTALSTQAEAFRMYSVSQDLKFQQSPFRVDFAKDASLYEEAGIYRLVSALDDLKVDLSLTPTTALTWFAHSRWYQHFSLLMRYDGTISQQGHSVDVSGLCTLEHFKSASVSMLPKALGLQDISLPLTSFSYQVINLNAEEQLVLAFVGFAGQPAYTSVNYRHIDGTSIQYDHAYFEVIASKTEPMITLDGHAMEVPQSFCWTAHHEGVKVLDIVAVMDTPMCYGLAAGYVSSYQWTGEFQQLKAQGRGYVEFIDRR